MPETTRQLAAIMFTDIVGYTALMGESEEKALEIRRRNKEIHQRLIDANGGKWLKEVGDGTLASFTTITDTVKSAIEIRQSCKDNLDIELKIGIHLGEVVYEDNDVFGDGVNIASRIQELADKGGILISEPVFNEIKNKEDFDAAFIGETSLKNVNVPVKVYQVLDRDLVKPSIQIKKVGGRNKLLRAGAAIIVLLLAAIFIYQQYIFEKPLSVESIAILPFANYTGDSSQVYLVSGMHDALIGELGQIGAIRVISKTSTLQYANSQKTIKEIAAELNVDAIIEASVLSISDNIRIQLKLINAFPEEQQLWSQTFDSDMSNILNLYSQVTKNIANEIQLALSPEQQTRLAKTRQVNPAAYEAYLKGKFNMGFLTREGIMAAMDYFKKAIEIDPEFAPAHAGLGGIWAFLKQMDFVSPDEADPKIQEHLAKALAIDSTLAEVYYWNAAVKVWTDFEWESGEIAFKRSIELNPNFSEARALLSHLMMDLNRWTESREQMRKALEIDPNNPFVQGLSGIVLMMDEKYDSCIRKFEPMQKKMPNNPLINIGLLLCYAETDRYDQAIEEIKKQISPKVDEAIIKMLEDEYENSGVENSLNKIADVLENTDSAVVSAQIFQMLYGLAGNTDKTLDWIERGYIRRESNMPYIAIYPFLKPYRNEPRFIEIVKRMNLTFDKLE